MDVNYWLQYQKEWLKNKSSIRIWEKSRRVGATYVQAFEDVYDCVNKILPKSSPHVWFAAQTEENAREYIRYCAKWAQMWNILDSDLQYQWNSEDGKLDFNNFEKWNIIDEKKSIKCFELMFNNGYSIHVLSSNPIRFRGAGGKIVLDEFDFHPNPQELWETITPCTMWGGRICILSTYSEEQDSFYKKLIKNIKQGDKTDLPQGFSVFVNTVTIYDAIDQGLVDKINKETGQSLTPEQFIAIEQQKCKIAHEGADWENHWAREYLCEPRKNLSLLAVKHFSDKNLADVQYKAVITESLPDGSIKTIENPVYLSCDFNWSQNCWTLGHIYRGDFFKFKEYCQEMYTEDLIKLVLSELDHDGLIIINGDSSGKKQSSSSTEGARSDYMIIENALIKAGYPQESGYYKSGKRYRRRTNDFNKLRSGSFYQLNSMMADNDGNPRFYVNPVTCPITVYAYENLQLKPGTSKYKTYTEKQMENNYKLKYMDDIVDADRYWVGANAPLIKEYSKTPDRPLTPLEQWKRQGI